MAREHMEEEGQQTPGSPEGGTKTLTYKDIMGGMAELRSKLIQAQDADERAGVEKELEQMSGERNRLIADARAAGLLEQVDQYVQVVAGEARAKRMINQGTLELIEREFSEEQETVLPEKFRGLKKDYYEEELRRILVEETRWPPVTEPDRQQEKLAEKLSQLEAIGVPYSQLRFNPALLEIESVLPTLAPEVQAYYQSRTRIFDAGLLLPNIGGSAEAFMKGSDEIYKMDFFNTMLHQEEVSLAFQELEKRANRKELIPKTNPVTGEVERNPDGTPKYEIKKEDNPLFAVGDQKHLIDQQIALEVAVKIEKRQLPLPPAEQLLLIQKYIWAVRQGETIWRYWLRAAQEDDWVFKQDTPEDIKAKLLGLRATEIPAHWDEIRQYVDFASSFNGTGEFAIRRLINPSYFQKTGMGMPRLRPHLYTGAKDFASTFLDHDFLTNPQNFTDGKAFEVNNVHPDPKDPTKPDLNRDVEYVKRDDRGNIVERVARRRNGVISSLQDFDFSKTKWNAKGQDIFSGAYKFLNIALPDQLRKFLMDPDKLGRDPSMKALLELQGSFEHLPSVRADLESGKNLDEERAKGKIYREDAAALLLEGLLKFQKYDSWKELKTRNINADDIDTAINMVRGRVMITDEHAKKLKRKLMAIDGLEATEVLQPLILFYYRANPGGILWAMILEFFKQSFSVK